MHYAVYLPNCGAFADARLLADLALDAERAGWEGVFLWDHIAGPWCAGPKVDPWVALSAIALRTERVRLGPMVTPLPRRRPWKVARESASLDRLSNGRLILGVGIGGGEAEFGDLGEEPDPKVRAAMLDEGLEVLAGLWRGEPLSHQGEHYHLQTEAFLPRPIQQPRISVWVAGHWPHQGPFRRAARWDGVFPQFEGDDEAVLGQIREMVALIRGQRAPDAPFEVAYSGRFTAGDDPERTAALAGRFAAAGVTWWLERIDPARFGRDFREEWPLAALRERIRQGPPVG
jgi:alkanesulfonate monooxygenase SsuD/methylene tetrahydromethanopterin reductase-like flavin-dependent oxidoreductase (luciferase family)